MIAKRTMKNLLEARWNLLSVVIYWVNLELICLFIWCWDLFIYLPILYMPDGWLGEPFDKANWTDPNKTATFCEITYFTVTFHGILTYFTATLCCLLVSCSCFATYVTYHINRCWDIYSKIIIIYFKTLRYVWFSG